MADWTKSMKQSFEYFIVDPDTWNDTEPIDMVISCSVKFDSSYELFATASFECEEDIGEKYIRVYLVVVQNNLTERFPLGVWIVQTPSIKYQSGRKTITMDCYSPLIDIREKYPDAGYTIAKGENIMTHAARIISNNSKVPLISSTDDTAVLSADYTAENDETYLTFVTALLNSAGYSLQLNRLGKVYFAPTITTATMEPEYIFNDDNSSLLQADVTVARDMYGIPNRVEVINTTSAGYETAVAVNDDEDSPVSTVTRGRTITERIVNPETILRLQEYADKTLKEKSCLEYTVTFTHGFLPDIGVGSCVRLNYEAAGLLCDVRITSQSIDCTSGCQCTETGKMTISLWK